MKTLTLRLLFTALLLAAQLALIWLTLYRLSSSSVYIYAVFIAISLIAAVRISSEEINPSFKIAWIIPMLTLPLITPAMYILFRTRRTTAHMRRRYNDIQTISKSCFEHRTELPDGLDPAARRQFRYILSSCDSGIAAASKADFTPSGEDFFYAYLSDLSAAESFIFIEYFIIGEGRLWSAVSELLIKKAALGITVKVLYDDLGTIALLDKGFIDTLKENGIEVCVFNALRPSIDIAINYRDHRKITVIDGKIAYTGGLNLSDEYVNITEPYGYWKDCALLLEGDAVDRMAMFFLQLWYFSCGSPLEGKQSFSRYILNSKAEHDGYLLPFSDGPFNHFPVCEPIYLSLITSAESYIYITTPYLIVDYEMTSSLRRAKLSGVDVRIITPHHPDKWYVHAVTRSCYAALLDCGIEIYEYSHGFVHSKSIVSDDKTAVVATANFDFRSFYLHFENGVYLYKASAVMQIKSDYLSMLENSIKINREDCEIRNPLKRLGIALLKLLSPLM